MPSMKNKSTPDLLRDWEGLLQACKANGQSLPELTEVLETLEDAIIRMKTLGSLREVAADTAQDTTKKLHQTREAGSESARRLRSFLKAQLGTRSEQLQQYGIALPRARSTPKKQPSA
jgi:hypothetical protein